MTEIVRTLNGDVRAALEEARAAYRLCLRHDRLAEHLKGFVRMHLWQVEKQLGLHARYFSQAGQDRYLDERIFRSKRNGTFVEIGGYDGWMGSNCVFFEKVLGWTGLVVEASPQLVQRIGETRRAEVVHAAVADQDGTARIPRSDVGPDPDGRADGPLSRRGPGKDTPGQAARGDRRHGAGDAARYAAARPRPREDRLLLHRRRRGRARRAPFARLRRVRHRRAVDREQPAPAPTRRRTRTSWARPATGRWRCWAWTRSGSRGPSEARRGIGRRRDGAETANLTRGGVRNICPARRLPRRGWRSLPRHRRRPCAISAREARAVPVGAFLAYRAGS